MKTCRADNCTRGVLSSGLCSIHYDRMRRGGTLERKYKTRAELEHFREAAIKSNTKVCILWPYAVCKQGYPMIKIDRIDRRVHRQVCERRHGPAPKDKPFACHSCGRPACINPNHLYWGSPQDNSDDTVRHGTAAKGERNGLAKLTEGEVRAIYLSRESQPKLAKRYGVARNVIYLIHHRKTWRHVTDSLPDRL